MKGGIKKRAAGNVAKQNSQARSPISSIPDGETLVVFVPDKIDLTVARTSFEHAMCNGKSWLGLTPAEVAPQRVFALYDSPGAIDQARTLMGREADRQRWHPVVRTAPANVHVLSEAGQALLESELRVRTLTTLAFRWPRRSKVALELFQRLARLSQRNELVLVIFVSGSPERDKCEIGDGATSSIELIACEPDHKNAVAFTFRIAPGSLMALKGIRARMFQVRIKGGSVERKQCPFIAEALLDRQIHKMRADGANLEQIGEVLGLNKSNVSRRLQRLPPVQAARSSPS